jgi:hypothetical protein
VSGRASIAALSNLRKTPAYTAWGVAWVTMSTGTRSLCYSTSETVS